ncbi:MAG: Fe-S cluster assembly protein IscX [Bacteroidetes bacterium]|nr:Fe-S cluster assembly protein IscX [Bacteroidota bacterium]
MHALKHTWQDVAGLADELCAAYPATDPLRLSPDELRQMVLNLPGFSDAPRSVSQDQLEAIQAAWYDARENV